MHVATRLKFTVKTATNALHFSDYFEDPLTGGEDLGKTTDQIIEHCHSYIDRTFRKSR